MYSGEKKSTRGRYDSNFNATMPHIKSMLVFDYMRKDSPILKLQHRLLIVLVERKI